MTLLGIDLGTSGVRASAYTDDGVFLADAARSLRLRRPAPGRVELDAAEVLSLVAESVGELTSHPAVHAREVASLSFSVLGEAVSAVDKVGRPLGPAPVSMDTRGAHLIPYIAESVGARAVQQITGQPLHSMFSVYKVAAGGLGGRLPARVMTMGDLVAVGLGAEPAIDFTMAARTGAFDVGTLTWSEVMADAVGVPTGVWPAVVPPGTRIGAVSAHAADTMGLLPGTPIVVGSHDQACSYWGAGGRAETTSIFALGSSDCLAVTSTSRPDVLGTGLATYPVRTGSAGELWLTLAGTAAGGWALEWWSELVGAHTTAERAQVLANPAADPPPLLVLPYLVGSGTLDNDPAARGAVIGLTLETTREQLTRAFLEAPGYELARIAEALAQRSVGIGAVRAVGSGAQSATSLRLRAAAAGRPLRAVPGNASARGAALQAGVGIGMFAGIDALPEPELAVEVADPSQARESERVWYAAQRARFADLAARLAPFSHGLSAHGSVAEPEPIPSTDDEKRREH